MIMRIAHPVCRPRLSICAILTGMSATAVLVARLHVDLQRVASAVCPSD